MEQQMQAGGVNRHSRTGQVMGRTKTWHWFTINAKNNKILATSETYKTKQAMERGIAALKSVLA